MALNLELIVIVESHLYIHGVKVTIGIVQTYVPYSLLSVACGMAEVCSYVHTVISR